MSARWAIKIGYIIKMFLLFGLNLRLGLGIRVNSLVKVRFKIRFYDFVAVPASDHSAELPPVHESSQ